MANHADQQIGNYLLLRMIGQGSLTTVFLGEHLRTGRKAIVKVFHTKLTGDDIEKFRDGARILANLEHPHILRLLDIGIENGVPFLVMTYAPGGSLREKFPKGTRLSLSSIVTYVKQVASALQYAHNQGLIHQNVKPENMLLGQNNQIQLDDFYFALLAEGSNFLSTQEMVGTVDYLAPEQIQGKPQPTSDEYSLAIVIYEWLSGYCPFHGSFNDIINQHMITPPPPLRDRMPAISLEVEQVVLTALAKDPRKRFASVQAFARAFEQASQPALLQPYVSPNILTPQSQFIPPTTMDTQLHQSMQPDSRVTTPGTYAPTPTTFVQRPRFLWSPIGIIALVLVALFLITGSLAAAFSRGLLGPHTNPISTQHVQSHKPTIVPSANGSAVPPTLTSCPATGTARAAVMHTLVLGSDQNIIYIADQGTLDNPISAAIERHDVTNGAQSVEIIKMPQTYIEEAHVSQDGQWILFTAKVAGQSELRMVRVDGQGLQTILCAAPQNTIFGTQWTFDQKVVVFDEGGQSSPPGTYLLDITSGKLQLELQPSSNPGYKARLWISSTKLYVVGFTPNSDTIQNIYILDTKNGANQQDTNLKQVANISQSCVDFDSSYDNNLLFISQCTGGFDTQQGPSSINIQLSIGSVQNTIYSSSALAVTTVRAIGPTTLLLMVENSTGDTSQNGLWTMNTDGTELKRLTTDSDGSQGLCPFSQYSWANLSRDGTMYALQSNNLKTNTSSMAYSSMKGGSLTRFNTISGTELYLVGWTTL